MRSVAISVAVILAGCGIGGADSSAEADLFRTAVVPIFEQDCGTAACHAAEGDRFEELDPTYFVFPVDAEGRIPAADIERARQRAQEKLSAAGPMFAHLIRKPLDESLGGQAHRGGSQYRSMSDETLATLMRWAAMAQPDQEPALTRLEQLFADEVQPVLAEKRCMLTSCHGSSASNFLKFDPGVQATFDNLTTQHNYGTVMLHLNLESPDPMMARLVRKTIPVDQGGVFHRGGNAFFDPGGGDEALEALLSFMSEARAELGVEDTGMTTGMVFAASPPAPRNLFDLAAWQPGGDVYSLIPAVPGGTVTNLTAGHHAGPADIRDPAVSYDGTRIAFAMRRAQDDCLNLYVMNLDGSALTQITHDTGTTADGLVISNVEPLWGPDDRIYFVSTRAGALSASHPVPQSNLWRIDADGSNLLRMSYSAGNELAPAWRFYEHHSHAAPELRALDIAFTATREVGDRMHGAIMRVPPDFRADYHPHYGTQHPDYQIFTHLTNLPDQRDALIVMDEANVWEGGALGIIDRNLGPVIKDGGEPSVVNYADSLQLLGTIGENVAHRGLSPGGYYRDPAAEPEGTLLVSHSPAAIDLADPTASPDPALYRLTLAELQGNRTFVLRKELLLDLPGLVEADPSPIYLRRREEIEDPLHYLSNERDDADLLNFDLSVALTVAAEDSPSRTKEFDAMAADIRWIRLVEEVSPTVADYPAWPDASASSIGRGRHGIRRILGEFPASTDRSMYVRLPAGVPFFVQALDDTRAATATFNQWFFLLPGETLKQVTRREVWDTACGACHGSRSGEPGQTVGTADVLTEASLVVANWDPDTRTELPPVPWGLEPGERLEVDFERDVQPILEARCATAGCHAAGAIAPDLGPRPGTAGFSGAYEALTDAGTASGNGFSYVDPDSSRARTSYFAEVLMQRDLEAPRTYDSSGCPGGNRVTLNELAALMRWMDLGASYRGIGPTTRPALPTY